MDGHWLAGPGQAWGWLPMAAALACVVLAGCGHAGANNTFGGANVAVCANAAKVDRLTIDRLNLLHERRFSFPAQIIVTDARHAQAVAEALCALPPVGHRSISCPADWGVRYRLRFAASAGKLTPVTVAATGCWVVTGLGPVRLIPGFGFWSVLGKAASLGHTSYKPFVGTAIIPQPAGSATPPT